MVKVPDRGTAIPGHFIAGSGDVSSHNLDPDAHPALDVRLDTLESAGSGSAGKIISSLPEDGSNVTTAMNTALSVLSAGDIYVLKAGVTYRFANINPPNGITIQQHGARIEPPTGSAANTPCYAIGGGSDKVRIEGGDYHPNSVTYADATGIVMMNGSSGSPVTNFILEQPNLYAPLFGQYVQDSEVRRPREYEMTGNTTAQIFFRDGCVNLLIDTPILKGGGGNGISLRGDTDACSGVKIVNPVVTDFARMGIETWRGSGVVQIDSPFVQTTKTAVTAVERIGISVAGNASDITEGHITNPIINMPTSAYAGIEIIGCPKSTVTGGSVTGGENGIKWDGDSGDNTGAFSRGGSITGTSVTGFNSYGILVFNYAENVTIEACPVALTVSTALYCILIDGGSGNTHADGGEPARRITLSKNPLSVAATSPSTTRCGIVLINCQDCVVDGNPVYMAVTGATAFAYGILNAGLRNVIQNNMLTSISSTNTRGIGTAGGAHTGSRYFNNTITGFDRGMVLDDSDYILVGGNYSDNANPDTAAFVGVGGRNYTIYKNLGPDGLAIGAQP